MPKRPVTREPAIRARSYERAPEPEVERRVRGPRHRRPVLLRFTAFLHILCRLAFVLSIVVLPYIVILHPAWFNLSLVLPGLWVVSGLMWLMASSRIGCRVCGMRMFSNKTCAKSVKAPAWPGLGPHTTMAVLSLCSKAVRCPYCGTPNELGERNGD